MNDGNTIVLYKGRRYRLKFRGNTRYGHRCKLEFMDGTKEFWVDSVLVTDVTGGEEDGEVCAACGQPGSLVEDMEDGLRKHRGCCDLAP